MRINHLSFSIFNVGQMKAFYTEYLGFEVFCETENILYLKNKKTITDLVFVKNKKKDLERFNFHFGERMTTSGQLKEKFEEFKKIDTFLKSNSVHIEEGYESFMINDPDGNQIEFYWEDETLFQKKF